MRNPDEFMPAKEVEDNSPRYWYGSEKAKRENEMLKRRIAELEAAKKPIKETKNDH